MRQTIFWPLQSAQIDRKIATFQNQIEFLFEMRLVFARENSIGIITIVKLVKVFELICMQ